VSGDLDARGVGSVSPLSVTERVISLEGAPEYQGSRLCRARAAVGMVATVEASACLPLTGLIASSFRLIQSVFLAR